MSRPIPVWILRPALQQVHGEQDERAHLEELAVRPEPGGRTTGERRGLGDLVLVMREDVVDAAGVDVELVAEVAVVDA